MKRKQNHPVYFLKSVLPAVALTDIRKTLQKHLPWEDQQRAVALALAGALGNGAEQNNEGEERKGQGGSPTLTPNLLLFSLFPSHLPEATARENLKIREREGKGHHTDMGLLEVVLIFPHLLSALVGFPPPRPATSISPRGFTSLHCWM